MGLKTHIRYTSKNTENRIFIYEYTPILKFFFRPLKHVKNRLKILDLTKFIHIQSLSDLD